MPVILPVELQLYIFQLALPPLILSRLNERVQLCKAFSLVHRTWTPTAQRELHEHFSTTLLGGVWRFSEAYGSLVAAQVGGRPLKRMDLKVIGYAEDVEDTDFADKQPFHFFPPVEGSPTFGEMWVELKGRGTPVWQGGSVHRLHIHDLGPERPTHLDCLPTNLTYLALHGVTIDEYLPTPHLRTFLCSKRISLIPVAELLADFPDLQIFGCAGFYPSVATFLAALPSGLLHLAFALLVKPYTKYRAYDLEVALPFGLKSCTFVDEVSTNSKHRHAAMLTGSEACKTVGAQYTYKSRKEARDWTLKNGRTRSVLELVDTVALHPLSEPSKVQPWRHPEIQMESYTRREYR